MGRVHVANLRCLPDIAEVLVCDPRLDPQDALGADEAIERADGVVIAAPTELHFAFISRCLEARTPVFSEKPMTGSIDEGRHVLRMWERHGTPLQVGFQRRFDGEHAAARRTLADSTCEVYGFQMRAFDGTPPSADYLSGSGGFFRDSHVHDFDTLGWLLGTRVRSVYASGRVVDPTYQDPAEDVDVTCIQVELDGGVSGSIIGTRHDAGSGYDIACEIFTSCGSVAVGTSPARRYTDFTDRFAQAYKDEIRHFAAVVQGSATSACDPREALHASLVAEAATLSWQTGARVDVQAQWLDRPLLHGEASTSVLKA